jgi:hypothetical protein
MPGEAPLKPKPQRRSDTQIPLIRLATRLMLERGLGTSSWSEKHVDVRPIKLSELPARRRASCQGWQFKCLDREHRISSASRRIPSKSAPSQNTLRVQMKLTVDRCLDGLGFAEANMGRRFRLESINSRKGGGGKSGGLPTGFSGVSIELG